MWFFVNEIYIKSNGRLSKNTHVFEPLFSDIYFTDWVFFPDISSVFAGLTGVISDFLIFFLLFYCSDILHGHLHIQRWLIHTFADFLFARFKQTVMSLSGRHLTISSFHNQSKACKSMNQPTLYMQVTVKYIRKWNSKKKVLKPESYAQ